MPSILWIQEPQNLGKIGAPCVNKHPFMAEIAKSNLEAV